MQDKKGRAELDPETNRVANIVYDCMFAVHRELGPGLLEAVYEKCLAVEIASRGLKVLRQVILPVVYRGHRFDEGLRLDLLVEDRVVVEVKAVEVIHGVHMAQTLTYLKLSGHRLAFLVNFNVMLMKDGIERIIH